ncbi:DUF3649 domain-containing protein [Pararoseomonas indoligenes]|uniref:DUF3649 domain-containing protein n=1 Tax=Roseomonas indoligenes TaxID=2820811 RepID=A0A940N1R8_9PROT|nr:DUF3649 domain-containing protein [Pararoseomonas indoligenes]MBP0494964.1 DUF3649 domain-containing protein [Pararoseomonas indoligenes]
MTVGVALRVRGINESGGRWRAVGIAVRVAAAVLGGYALATLSSVALAVTLPMARADAVLTGMMAGVAVHAASAIWVFAARSAARAWGGLLVAALPLAAMALLGQWQATGRILP